DIVQLNPIKCEVREAVLVGSAFHFRRNTLQYSWNSVTGNIVGSNNLDTIRVNRPATYTFRAIDTINNCSEARFISVSEDEDDLDTFTVRAIDPVCFAANDGTIRIVNVEGGTAPYGISLSSTTPFVRDSIIRNLRAGTYSVFLRDSFGCAQSTMITLNEGQRTFVRLPNDTTLTLGSNLIVDYVSDIDPQSIRDIIWMASNGQNCDGCTSYDGSFLDNTNLLLVVTNANGCVAIDSMNIFVLPIINWVFPNILSVSSNENSTLIIPENAGVDVINNFSIYDRWGNIIWQAQNFKPGDPNFNFDIRNQSSTIENGVYIFKIDATLINGAKWQRVKDFTVIK
ncbi:MAG TPA: SprB repeat-containing protein, partial [Saprospiraceae bacterium]|nr:SprB repeat-containing protein [Saprospiraceae bacterium]